MLYKWIEVGMFILFAWVWEIIGIKEDKREFVTTAQRGTALILKAGVNMNMNMCMCMCLCANKLKACMHDVWVPVSFLTYLLPAAFVIMWWCINKNRCQLWWKYASLWTAGDCGCLLNLSIRTTKSINITQMHKQLTHRFLREQDHALPRSSTLQPHRDCPRSPEETLIHLQKHPWTKCFSHSALLIFCVGEIKA